MEELDADDMLLIATNQFQRLPAPLLERMIGFTRALQREVSSCPRDWTLSAAPPTSPCAAAIPHPPTAHGTRAG